METRYRYGGNETLPFGEANNLIYAKSSRTAKLVSAERTRLLNSCSRFLPIDKHAEAWCQELELEGLRTLAAAKLPGFLAKWMARLHAYADRGRGGLKVHPQKLAAVRDQLEQYARAGLLVSDVDLIERCRQAAVERSPARISIIGMTTRDRVDTLRRALVSYSDNCRAFGRSVAFTVIDDSGDPVVEERNQAMLEALGREHPVSVRYANRLQRETFLTALIDASGIPAETVRFGLLGEGPCARTVGASRNTLLLDSIGACYMLVDDDSVCRIAKPEEQLDGLALTSQHDPTEFRFFSDRDATLRSIAFVEQEFLALHEALLGRDLGACLPAVEDAASLDLDRATPAFDQRLRSFGGRVVTASAGIFGDSGVGTTGYLYAPPSSRKRLTRSPEEYLAAVKSRQLFRAVTRTTISEGALCMAGNLSLDNRRLLPPFYPLQRNSDGLFAAVLRKCFRDGYLGYLPWAIWHDPPQSRSQPIEQFFEGASRTRLPEIVKLLIRAAPDVSGGGDDGIALRKLGAHLKEVASGSLADFEEVVRTEFWRAFSVGLAAAEEPGLPDFYAAYRRKYLAILRQSLAKPEYLLPLDLMDLGSDQEIRQLVKRLVRQFGEFLEIWPAVIKATKELHDKEIRLTKAVGPQRASAAG